MRNFYFFFFFLLLFSNSIFAQTIVVGSTEGVFDVSDLGAANYTIPINIPNGVGGMQPSLSLNYNSNGGNGIMGMGWSLSAVSAITRVANNIYHDKKVTGVKLTNEDKFALDGNRLILKSGVYGGVNSQYYTEIEKYSEVKATGVIGSSPEYFTITDPDGKIYEYGKSPLSRATVIGSTEPYMWLLEKVTDLNGSYVTYSYSVNNFEDPRLISIAYNHHTGLMHTKVSFEYEVRSDKNIVYLAGGAINQSFRLKSIIIGINIPDFNNFIKLRTYEFNYASDVYTHLINVKEKGMGQQEEFKPTEFTYGGANMPTAVLNPHSVLPTGQNLRLATGDYNGDGKTDVISYSDLNGGGYNLYLNNGTTNSSNFTLTSSGTLQNGFSNVLVENLLKRDQTQVQFFDYNGDGKDDFAYFQNYALQPWLYQQKYWIYTSNGNSLNENYPILSHSDPNSPNNQTTFASTMPFIGDFDGDGKTEILLLNTLKPENSPTGTGSSNYLIGEEYNSFVSNHSSGLPAYKAKNLGQNLGFDASYIKDKESVIRVIDINGDGKNEILSIWQNNADIFELNVTFDVNNKPVIGNPIFKHVIRGHYPTVDHEVFNGDFNGDGATDVLTWKENIGWKIGYGNGKGEFVNVSNAPYITNKPRGGFYDELRPIILNDYNGDGKCDIFEYTANSDWGSPQNPRVLYSQGYNDFNLESLSIDKNQICNISSLYFPGDFNGDGSIELLTSHIVNSTRHIISFHPNENRHLISKITNGLGAFVKINYGTLANSTIYQPGSLTNTYPIIRRTIPLKVVSSIVDDNGINSTGNTTTFKYEGLKFTYWGKGILGFDKVTNTNSVTLASSTKSYTLNTTYFTPQLTYILSSVNGTTVNTQFNEYGIKDFGNKRIFPYLIKTSNLDHITQQNTRTIFDYGTTVVGIPDGFSIGKPKTVTVLKGYEDYFTFDGNQIIQATNHIEKTVQKFDYPNPYVIIIGQPPVEKHMLFKPTKITTTQNRTGNADYVRAVSFKYDNQKGNLIESKQDPGTSNAVTTALVYNGYGNLIQKTVSAVGLPVITDKYEYDPTMRYVTKAYNDAYPALASISYYELFTGNLLNKTEPDGLVTSYTYDAFNRPKTVSNNNGMFFSTLYQWTTGATNVVYQVQTDDNLSEPSVGYYDRLGRLVKQSNVGFNGDDIVQEIAYNAKGQKVSEKMPRFITDPVLTTTFHYDLFGRQTQVATPTGTTTFAYASTTSTGISNNNSKYKITVTNALAQTKSSTSDASGKTTLVEDEGGALNYLYNSAGATKSTTLNGTIVQTSEYDNFGRSTHESDPNYGSYIYTYNAYDQVLTQKDPKNNIYNFTYDGLGNVKTKTGLEGTYTYTHSFDPGNNAFKLIKLVGPEGTINYNYGKGNQVLGESRRAGSETFTNSYLYDDQGRVKQRTYPDGSIIAYVYNQNDGSLSNLGVPGETYSLPGGSAPAYIHSITHKNAYGQTIAAGHGSVFYSGPINNPNQPDPHGTRIWSTFGYSQYGLLTGELTKIPGVGGSPGTTLKSFQYNFNASTGNLSSRKDLKYNKAEYFDYDNLNRLYKAQFGAPNTNPLLLDLTYSNNGNITEKTDVGTFTYDVANRVSEIEPFINIPSTTQYTNYTAFNKIKDISEGSIKAVFTYWPDGERASMEVFGGQNPRKVYYAPGYEKIVTAGNPDRHLSYIDNGSLVAIMETVGSTQSRYYVLTDYLGSITQILSANGAIVEEKSFDAWGRPRNPITWSLNGAGYFEATYVSNGWDRGYTRHEHIPEFGIINMNGRLYDPLMGRMFSPDPYIIGTDNTQGYNRYSYALNNPLNYTDPSGENPLIIAMAIGAGISALTYTASVVVSDAGFQNWNWSQFAFNTLLGAVNGALTFGVGSAFSATFTPVLGNIGFVGGFATGAATGSVTGFFIGANNGINQNANNPFLSGLEGAGIGAISGGIIGGISSGINSVSNKRNFFTGSFKQYMAKDALYAGPGYQSKEIPSDYTVYNDDYYKVYYRTEDGVSGMSDYVKPGGHYIKDPVDGIATSRFSNQVFKLPDGGKAFVHKLGNVTGRARKGIILASKYHQYSKTGTMGQWGWLGREYFQSINSYDEGWHNLFEHAKYHIR